MATLPDLAKAAGIQQGAGVVGKLCTVALMAFAALGVGLYSMSGDWPKLGAQLGGMAIVAGMFVWFVSQTLRYAEKHPEEAAMECGDLLKWRMKSLEVAGSKQPAAVTTTNVSPTALPKTPEDTE